MSEKLVVYGSALCPMVPPVRNLLKRGSVPYDYVSISLNRAARQRVMEINAGNASVPTLVFPDGSTLTEPPMDVLHTRLEALGYTFAPETFMDNVVLVLQSPRILSFGAIFLAVGVTFNTPSLTFAGAVLLAMAVIGWLIAWFTQRAGQ